MQFFVEPVNANPYRITETWTALNRNLAVSPTRLTSDGCGPITVWWAASNGSTRRLRLVRRRSLQYRSLLQSQSYGKGFSVPEYLDYEWLIFTTAFAAVLLRLDRGVRPGSASGMGPPLGSRLPDRPVGGCGSHSGRGLVETLLEPRIPRFSPSVLHSVRAALRALPLLDRGDIAWCAPQEEAREAHRVA